MELLDFFLTAGKLKRVQRTGWKRYKIPHPETVAEHSFRTALLAMFLAPKVGVDQCKVMKMALIHDLGEAEIGDIVTHRGIEDLPNLPGKIRAERNALLNILGIIGQQEIITLFDEFEANKTSEAQFVKQLDVLEMAMQAYEYEKEYKINLEEFFEYAKSKIHIPMLVELFREILEKRDR